MMSVAPAVANLLAATGWRARASRESLTTRGTRCPLRHARSDHRPSHFTLYGVAAISGSCECSPDNVIARRGSKNVHATITLGTLRT